MLSISDGPPGSPCPAPFNLAGHVLARAAEVPDKVALAVLGTGRAERWSYGRLRAAVLGTAGGLRAAGGRPGDRVLLRLGNAVDFPVVFLGAIAAGLVPVPTSAQLTGREADAIAEAVAPAFTAAGEGIALPARPGRVLDSAALAALREAPPLADFEPGDPDRLAYIVFTSGTAGRPRGVRHAHRAIWARRAMVQGWYGLTGRDRVLHAGAFNWTYTLGTGLLDPWTLGATALIPGAGITPAELPLLLARHGATIFAAAPGVYRQMLRAAGGRLALPQLRHGLSAGEKLPETTRAAWQAATGTEVHEAFGMSECSTFISGSPARPAPAGTLGFAQPGRRVAILGEDGAPVPRGTPGTIAVDAADPGLMLGYLDGPDLPPEGWFATGDTGAMACDGAIAYLGRADDMMNAGGYRVSPLEVERALAEHPEIVEAAAVELRVKADASVIGAFYVAEREIDGLEAFAAERLARYKCPRVFRRIEALPRGANGKLLRRTLRERYSTA